MHTLLLSFFLIFPSCARADDLPEAVTQAFDKIPWQDPRYPATVWLYLQRIDPLLQGRWIGLLPQEQARFLALAAQKYDESGMVPANPGAPPSMIGLADRLVFDTPQEKQLSDYWNRYFEDNFQNNPVGRTILEHLKGGLPPMKIARLNPATMADFSPALVFIRVNSVLLLQEIASLDSGVQLRDDPKDLTAYLLNHPDITSEIFKSYRSIEAHEATHAAQSAAFRDDLLPSQDRADYLEAEKHAFTVQHRYTLAELEIDPRYLASASPIAKISRNSLVSCLIDYDRCMADIGPAYAQAHELAWVIAGAGKTSAANVQILERMKGFYEDFSQQTRQGWKDKNSRGLLLLAERLAASDPNEALGQLRTLQVLTPSEVQGQGGLATRFTQAVDAAIAALASSLQTGPPSSDKIVELDLNCVHFNRNFPPDLRESRRAAYKSEIDRLRSMSEISPSMAQRGRYMARVVEDTDAEKFFASKQ